MAKVQWKPGTLVYPVPAVMVSCGEAPERCNIITVAWTGTICSDPPMTYISLKPQRYSYGIIRDSGEFVINLTTEDTAAPVNIECRVRDIIELGSHHMFIAQVVSVSVDERYIDKSGRFNFERCRPVCYSHGQYCGLKKPLGNFGFSVSKRRNR